MGAVLNPFERIAQMVRTPAASAAPAAAPARPVQRGAHQLFHIRQPMVGIDAKGRTRTLDAAVRNAGFAIVGSAAAQADNDKRRVLARGSIGPSGANACGINLPGVPSAQSSATHTSAYQEAKNAPEAVLSAPTDLLAFAKYAPERQVAQALGTSQRQVRRIKEGYWPANDRALRAAWDAYKGRISEQQSGWFLRRVHQGGQVCHAGSMWGAPCLAQRAGQTLAVARTARDGLLAQTLELPSERFVLVALPESEEAAA